MPIFRRENGTLVAVPGNYAFLDQLGKLTADSMLVKGLISQIKLGGSTYLGFEAGLNDDIADRYNTGIGYQALLNVTTGYQNTAVGLQALRDNTTGYYNTAVGQYALHSNTTGYYNTAVGMQALRNNTTGGYNTAVGLQALQDNTTGYYNTAVGIYALLNNTTGLRNVALGFYAGRYELGNDAFYVNNQNRTNTAGDKAKSIIYGQMAAAVADQRLVFNAGVTVNGKLSQIGLGGSTYLGFEAGKVDDLSDNLNVGVGYQALLANTTGTYNTAVGYQALLTNSTGERNAALGYRALYANATGLRNIALGFYAGRFETGSDAFYVNNQDRVNTAGDKAKSIIYGQMAALVADQKLTFNADVKITGKTGLNNTAPVGKAAHIADPIDLDTAITAIKAILVVLENLGAVATA